MKHSLSAASKTLHNRNHRFRRIPHQNENVHIGSKTVATALLCGFAFCAALAQQETANAPGSSANRTHARKIRTLASDDRLAVLASALDSKTPRLPEYDCSHLVHSIYERAGFPYAYAGSDDLYDGVEGFQRVARP